MKRRLFIPERRILRQCLSNAQTFNYTDNRNSIHKKRKVESCGQKGEIDVDLVPLILELWRLRFITVGSCQCQPNDKPYGGLAYLALYRPDAHKFAVMAKEAGVDIKTEDVTIDITCEGKKKAYQFVNVHFSPEYVDVLVKHLSNVT